MAGQRHLQVLVVSLLLLGGGCTHCQLQRSTVNAASTQTALQYQQILENLAIFVCNHEALPWHIKLEGGIVQVTDQGSFEIGPAQSNTGVVTWLPSLLAARTLVAQWQVDPTSDPGDLELLRLAYLKAINPLDEDGSIRRAVYQEIAELSATKGVLLNNSVVEAIIEQKLRAAGDNQKKREELEETRKKMKTLYQEMDEWAERTDGIKERDHRAASILRRMNDLAELPYTPTYSHALKQGTSATEDAQDKIAALLELVNEDPDEPNPFSQPWLAWGCKDDVPKGACFVSHCKKCYVWVPPESAAVFRKFTLILLALAPVPSQSASPVVAFSPAF